ncbi:MAG: LamG domain-containing protein [Armatimonadetes bacterium]|nr:LamG domain-containing protein [Armatimonadota bacterium]
MKTYPHRLARMALVVWSLLVPSRASAADDPVADWGFEEGKGSVLHDRSGNRNDGKIHGAQWVKIRGGHALDFNGETDYVDCGNNPRLDLRQSVTIEAWVHPHTSPQIDCGIAGKHFGNYLLTFYKSAYYGYIAGGGNNVAAGVTDPDRGIGSWHHVVYSFDGETMKLYVDGRQPEIKTSATKAIPAGVKFFIGCVVGDPSAKDPALAQSGYFHGRIGRVRVYKRELTLEESRAHYKVESPRYMDAASSQQRVALKVAAFPYPAENHVVAEVDYRRLVSLSPEATLDVQLLPRDTDNLISQTRSTELPKWGHIEIKLSAAGLSPGRYVLRAILKDKGAEDRTAEVRFNYALPSSLVPSPQMKVAGPLAAVASPLKYAFEISRGGGFTVTIKGERFPFESTFSYPHGGENALQTSGKPGQGEAAWRVTSGKSRGNEYTVRAQGRHYTVSRRIQLLPGRIAVKDTLRNDSTEDLGLIVRNHLITAGKRFGESRLGGNKSIGRTPQQSTGAPSVFVSRPGLGIGFLPLDDVYIVQALCYNEKGVAGVATENFALAPQAEYTLEWAVYLNGTGDYFDFTNAVRKNEGRIGRIEGGFDSINYSMQDRRLILTPDQVRLKNLRYGTMYCLSNATDDPAVSIEGIEFMDFPKEMQVLRKTMTEFRASYPDLFGMFHVAHSLYVTNKPDEKFPDSKVIDYYGKQAVWPDREYRYITRERQAQGWQWWIYYPTPGNSFHDALLKSMDVMMDEIGCRGVFWDGMLCAYEGAYTYDGHWDGHSSEIDSTTKTLKRKNGSVILLSQPSIVEAIHKVQAKGGVVIANNCRITRTIGKERIIIVHESGSADNHLSQTPVGLGGGILWDETEVYRDVINMLNQGSLYFFIGWRQLRGESLATHLYPITCEDVRPGYARGPERIVTTRAGVYGWPGDHRLPLVYHYDGRGVPASGGVLTTADPSGVRTVVNLAENESSVLKRIPVTIKTSHPVNVLVGRYDKQGIQLVFNGHGKVRVTVADGTFEVHPKVVYSVRTADGERKVTASAAGELSFPLDLRGQSEITLGDAR